MRSNCTLRTNYWQTGPDGAPKDWISFKIDSRALDELPAPRPLVEVFVYSPRMEGIHLRGGRVARGGIRWSDRREDFRTEILGPDEDPDGEERRHRAGRLEGRLLRQAAANQRTRGRRHARAGPGRGHRLLPDADPRPARHHRQLRRGRRAPAGQGRAPRRRRSLSRGRRRQGHRHLLRHRQCARPGIRLLAGRCLRLGRLGGLRPQEDGHHRARRLGIGEAPLPRARPGHPDHAFHRGRRRRHVGRRVRQRHAAVAAHQASGRLRPPPHLHRPDAQPGDELGRAQAAVRPAALVVDGLRQVAAVGGRRHLRPRRQVDRALGRGAAGAGHRGARHDAGRPDARHPDGAGRPALFRRHRHLREGLEREPDRRRRSHQRCASASTPTSCARA